MSDQHINIDDHVNKVIDNLLTTSEGKVYTKEDFYLPSDMDFAAENFAIDLYNKINKDHMEFPLYIEAPFSTRPGYYEDEKVFIAKAVPYIKDAVVKNLARNEEDLYAAQRHEALNSDDGDTVYFMNKTLFSGQSSFTLGNRFYSSLNEFLNIQSNEYEADALSDGNTFNNLGKFGLRFLGINTPEIPHYIDVPLTPEDVYEFTYGEIKDKSNFVVSSYHLTSDHHVQNKRDDEKIKFFFDSSHHTYYEIIDYYFAEAYLDLTEEEKENLNKLNGTIAKILYVDSSSPQTVKKGLEAAEAVREMIGKAEDICLMLDQNSLSRQSNHYDSPYNQDYYAYGFEHGRAIWKTIKNYWHRFFSDARYRYLGFNAWGQDNNKRMLGTIYLKVVVEELGTKDPVWINLSKYILQKFSKDVTALPDYTSDPKENMHHGFVSSAFKLWSYNFTNQVIMDAFTTYTDDFVKERDHVFEELAGLSIKDIKAFSMILGDTVMIVPPTSIRCITQTQTERVPLLRSRGAASKQAPASEKIIELKLYFNNEEGINGTPYEVTLPNGLKTTYWMNGLRSLIAQFKLTPFLPIENDYINQVLNIFAVTLVNLQVTTLPGFPKCLQVTLTLQEFNYHVYMPELPLPELLKEEDLHINMFARCIHYPVMRWYYQRLLQRGEKIKNLEFNSEEYIAATFGSNTALIPMEFEDSLIEFYLPEKQFLQERLQVYQEKEARPLRSSYALTDNGKEIIRKLAPAYSELFFMGKNQNINTINQQLTTPFTIDYEGVASKEYKPYDFTGKNDDPEITYRYNCELMMVDKKWGYKKNFITYGEEGSSNAFKGCLYHFAFGRYKTQSSIENGMPLYDYDGKAPTTGSPYTDKHLAAYFNSIKAFSSFGSYEVVESLEKKNNKEGYIKFEVYMPMPQLLATQVERDEFLKMIISQLTLKDYNSVFGYNSAGMLCVKIEFLIPALIYSVNLFDTEGKTDVYIANGNITLNTACNGFSFLAYCDRNIDSIVLENGEKEYLDFAGDIPTNMTDETIDLNTYNYIESEKSIPFKKYELGEDIHIETISCSYSNSVARVKLNAMDGYAHQFCGGQDAVIEVSIVTKNEAAATLLHNLPRLAASYVIDYKEILPCWPLRIKSEITKLFGINEVLIETVDLSTVPNYPGLYTITLRMVAVDRSTRNRETLKKLDEVNNAGTITNGSKAEYMQNTFFDLRRVLGKAEIYPDLELPLVDELEFAGYKLTKYYNPQESTRKFLDPDFYFIYAHILSNELLRAAVDKSLNSQEMKLGFELNDKFGSYYLVEEDPHKKKEERKIPVIKKPNNQVAIDIEKQAQEAYANRYLDSAYDTLNKKGWHQLSEKNKISSKLSQSLAGMKTPFWSITNKFVFPLREEQYQLVSSKDEKDTLYHQQIKFFEDKMYNAIFSEFNRPIDLKAIGINPITKENFPNKVLSNNDSLLEWAEDRISEFGNKYLRRRSFVNELMHDNVKMDLGFFHTDTKWFEKLLLAFADSATGYAFCEAKKVWLIDALNTDADKHALINWKLKVFNTYGGNVIQNNGVLTSDSIDWDNLAPYCKTRGTNQEFAINLDDAIEHGATFGPYQIQTYPKKAILPLMVSEYEKEQVLKSKIEFVFLDPYYRALQLKDPNCDELKLHKQNLLLDPAYCAYAYLRCLMVWYNYLLKEEIALSMYETIKSAARLKILEASMEDADNNSEAMANIYEDGDTLEKQTNKTYEKVFNEHAKVFATVYAVLYETKENEQYSTEAFLSSEGVPDVLYAQVAKYRKKTQEDLEHLQTSLRKDLKKLLENKSISEEEKTVSSDNYKLMLLALGYDYENERTIEITKETLLRYGIEISRQLIIKKEESRINNQTFQDVFEQLSGNRTDIISGKLIGLSFLLLKNGGTILSAMRQRNVNALDSLMLSLPTPTINGEDNDLRKYLLALDGRNVLALEYVGNSTQTAEELVKFAASTRINIDACNDIKSYLRDSYLDMIQNDKRGRMLRAFPTYYMLFIDEGREIGLWKLHDNFYNMNAVSEITVTKSRKIAADTAQITMSNMFKTFSTDDTQRDYDAYDINNVRYNMRDAFNSIFSPRIYAMKEESLRQMEETARSAQIRPGVRVHLRMGYGANAADLPILFNGNIAEVGTSDLVDIVAQGDGAELLNPITDIDDASDVENKEKFFIEKWVDNWLTNGATPKQIMTALLISKGSWLQEIMRTYSKGRFFNKNPYGIVHFGDQEFKDIFAAGEVVQNIYEANPRATYGEHEKYSGLETNYDTSETPVLSMHLLGKTFWDVMHICASVQPDFITSIVPFGMRSTIFYGAPRYYYAYDYGQQTLGSGKTIIKEKRKPFQQYHFYSSFTDIIHNNIRASAATVKTNAVGLYQEAHVFGDKVKQVGPLFVDFDIYPEFQKSMTVDTQLWAKGMPVFGNLLGWTADLSKDVSDKGLNPIPGAKEIAWRMTASALKNSMRDMYVGELTVIGDPSVKPYDRMSISDVYERMDGQCEVEAVVHTLNTSTGFTTSIYADCISIVDDEYEQYANMYVNQMAGYAAASLVANCVGYCFGKVGAPLVSSFVKSAAKPIGSAAAFAKNLLSFLSVEDMKLIDNIISKNDVLLSYVARNPVMSSFVSIFENNLKSTMSKLVNYATIDIVSTVQADDFFKHLETTYKQLDEGEIKKQLQKAIAKNGDDAALAKQALKDYDDLVALKKVEMAKVLKTDPELLQAVTKLSSNSNLDDTAKAILVELRANPDFLSDAENIANFRTILTSTADLGDDALDVAKACSGLMKKSNNMADIVLDVTDEMLKKNSIKTFFSIGKGATFLAALVPSLVLMALEMIITTVIGGYATEFIYRYLQNLEVLKIYPLKRKSRAMVAGIDGHKGVVVGSPTATMQGEWTKFVSSLFDGEKGGFLKTLINFSITNEDIERMAKRIRVDHNLPEPEGRIDSEILLHEIQASVNEDFMEIYGNNSKINAGKDAHLEGSNNQLTTTPINYYQYSESISKEIDAIYCNNSKLNSRAILRLNRYETLINIKVLEANMIDRDFKTGTIPNKNALSLKTTPIQEDEEIKLYLENDFATIFTTVQKGSVENLSINFGGKNITLECFNKQGAWNIPALRRDAILLLRDCLKIIFDDSGIANLNYEEDITPHVFITSATIIGGKTSWENTGLAFRLLFDSTNYTPKDVINFVEKMKNYYKELSAPNYMECLIVPDNEMETLFIVKPIKEYDLKGGK